VVRPDCILSVADLARTTMRVARSGEALTDSAILVDRPGWRVTHDVLPPGRRSASPHAHTTQEEMVYVIAGTPDLWLNGELHRLQPGEAAVFVAGTEAAHTLVNNSETDVVLLQMARLTPDDEVQYRVDA
jgi:uncharacterized cupin superfamily protein